VVGIDRGVAVAAALSTGELLRAPGLSFGEAKRLKVLQQRLARANRGSNRRAHTKLAIAKLKARTADRRKDWVEKVATDLARRFDVIRVEALDVRAMTRSARGTVEQPGTRVAQKRGLTARSAEVVGVFSPRVCSTRLWAGSSRFRLRTRRNDAPGAGMSLRGTVRAKRFSSAKPAPLDGATPTSTLHATSSPDGR
jgi:transposase